MPAPMKLTDVRNSAIRQGVSSNRFSVTREEAARIRKAERNGDGLIVVLQILREKSAAKQARQTTF
jgi:hypothetical protein